MQNVTPNGQPQMPPEANQQDPKYCQQMDAATMPPPPAPPQQQAGHAPHHHGKPRPRRRSLFGRFVRGYLMIVGALVNIFVLSQLLLILLEFVGEKFNLM
ncbi:MAG: hypothetical protein IJ041_03620 [Clostridia bacterium]|nr:hypothetical protein [Clostridia bacterium]